MKLIIRLIELYQKTISPDHGALARPNGFCPFYPTCSEYTKQSILKYGVLRGTANGITRILKCVPGTKPKIDLP
jgi:putative membrane protein insertion efficiency factor